MDAEQTELYRRIQEFSVDKSDSDFPFSQRLARENGWADDYAQRVIDEYKKFAFLAVAADHPVTPSDQVDQVWHLHLVYTHSYWDEFCQKVLQQPLHHVPTCGGEREHAKFNKWYAKTLTSYEAFFGYQPPEDIWPAADVRFTRDIHFMRVNYQQSWILPKPHKGWQIGSILIVVLVLSLTAYAFLTPSELWNPLNFRGSEFLRFYLVVVGVSVGLAYYLRLQLHQPTEVSFEALPQLNVYETAYLAAGGYRAINTAIFNLIQRGHLRLEPETRSLELADDLLEDSHPLEQVIMQAAQSDGHIGQVRPSALLSTKAINRSLETDGLLLNQTQAKRFRLYPALVIFAVLALGMAKIGVGVLRHKPVGYLILICIFVGWLGYAFLKEQPLYRSRLGNRLLKTLRSEYSGFRKSASSESAPMPQPQFAVAFAVFGASVLAGSPLADLGNILAPIQVAAGSWVANSYGCGGAGYGGSGGGGCGGCGG